MTTGMSPHGFSKKAIILGIAAAALAVGGPTLSASAADTGATVAVSAGVLGLTAPATVAFTAATPGGASTANLAGIAVTDDRADVLGWVSTVSLTDFTSVSTASVIPTATATYTPTAAVTTGTSSVLASGKITDLTAAQPVQTATAVNGNNSATWDAALTVTSPSNALAGSYTAVLTHSVL